MSLNSISFARDPIDMLSQFEKGLTSHLKLPQKEADIQKEQLENSLRSAKLPYAAQRQEAEIANLQRQAQFGGYTGPAQEALSLEMLRRQHGEDSPAYKNALKVWNLRDSNSAKNLEDKSRRINLSAYQAMSPEEQKRLQAAWTGSTGRPALELTKALQSGADLDQILNQAGSSLEQFGSKLSYPSGQKNIDSSREAEANFAAYETIQKAKSKVLTPNVQTIAGYSVNELKNVFNKSDPKVKGDILASRMLSSAGALSQALAEGGSNAHSATQTLMDAGLGNFKTLGINVTPEAYSHAYKIVSKVMEDAIKTRSKILKGEESYFDKGQGRSLGPVDVSSEMITIRNRKTGETETVLREEFERSKRK